MDELKRKLALLEEQNKAWRAQQNEIEKRFQLDYQRKLAKLNEDYETAVKEIDVKYCARREVIIAQYNRPNIRDQSVNKVQQISHSEKTKPNDEFVSALCLDVVVVHRKVSLSVAHNDMDGLETATHETISIDLAHTNNTVHLRIEQKQNAIESKRVGKALQNGSNDAGSTGHRTNSVKCVIVETVVQKNIRKEFLYSAVMDNVAGAPMLSGLFYVLEENVRENFERLAKTRVFDPGGTDKWIIFEKVKFRNSK
ncbi:uncharacterized protein LOC134211193 [Armigeres subalbatus]|uniref:uncharacterized protein LOC134211193 n=1 Tax=Armigeres subalbatus TaxID=124917 RepID=UPI002ED02970